MPFNAVTGCVAAMNCAHACQCLSSDAAPPWLVVQQHRGADAVQQPYCAVVRAGKGDARLGHMLGFGATGWRAGSSSTTRMRRPA